MPIDSKRSRKYRGDERFRKAEKMPDQNHCMSCGKHATKRSQYWPGGWLCDDCFPSDMTIAAEMAHHVETGG